MNRRNFLKNAGLSALVLATNCDCNIQPNQKTLQQLKFQQTPKTLYENCNLDEGKLEEFANSVEYLSVRATYTSSTSSDTSEWMGSGTIIHEDNIYQYILTAGHVAIADKAQKSYGFPTGRTLK